MDVLELDAASNNSVDNIRELLEQVRYPAQLGRYKVYIIDEVHMLSTAAFNALLKTLEEPPAHVVFILATTEPQKLPATILSRVQRYDFGRIPSSLMVTACARRWTIWAWRPRRRPCAWWRALPKAPCATLSASWTCAWRARRTGKSPPRSRVICWAPAIGNSFWLFRPPFRRDEGGVMQKVDELMRPGASRRLFARAERTLPRAAHRQGREPGRRLHSGCDRGGRGALSRAGGGRVAGTAAAHAGFVHARRRRPALRLHPAHRTGERRAARL